MVDADHQSVVGLEQAAKDVLSVVRQPVELVVDLVELVAGSALVAQVELV